MQPDDETQQPQPQPPNRNNGRPDYREYLPGTARHKDVQERIARRLADAAARRAAGEPSHIERLEAERAEQRKAEERAASGLCLPGYADMTFDCYDPKTPYQSRAMRAGMAYARMQPNESPVRGLCFYSPDSHCGVGKTHIALAIANACFERGLKVAVTTHSDLVERMYAAAHGRLEGVDSVDTVCRRLTRLDLVVLDDFGRKDMTGMAAEHFHWLVDQWVIRKRSVVFTTNLAPKHWEARYGSPTASRLHQIFGGSVAHIPVDGPNGRMESADLRELLIAAEQMTLTEKRK